MAVGSGLMTIPVAGGTDPGARRWRAGVRVLPAVNRSAGLVMVRRFSEGRWHDVRHVLCWGAGTGARRGIEHRQPAFGVFARCFVLDPRETKNVARLRNPAC